MDALVSRREIADASPGTKLQRAGTAMPHVGGSPRGAPRPAARRRSTRDKLCCISSPYNSAPRALHGVCVGVRPLSPAEPGENQTLAAVLSWQGSPDKPLRLCQGNRYPDCLPGANRLVFPRKTRKPCVGLGPERLGSSLASSSRQSSSRAWEHVGARLGVLGSAGVSEEGTVLASRNIVNVRNWREGGLRSPPASVPCFVLHGLPAKRP